MNFIERVLDSKVRLPGRIAVFALAMLLVYLVDSHFIASSFKEGVTPILPFFVSFAICAVGVFGAVISFAILFLFFNCIGWIITGDWDCGVFEWFVDVTGIIAAFIYMFLFGDWIWRKS